MGFATRALAVLAVATMGLGGCASFNRTKPAPAQQQPIAVRFTGAELSAWSDMPAGVYRVPDSQVIVSGHQKGGATGLLFGVIGVAVQSAINSSAGKDATKNVEDALRISLTSEAQRVTQDLLASGRFSGQFIQSTDAAGPTLDVTSAVVLTFVNATDARPYVLLKADLATAKGAKQSWETRYIASSGQPRPLSGANSWTADGGAILRSTVYEDLRHAIEVMLKDVSHPYVRDDTKLTTVQGYFPYLKERAQAVGYELGEDDRSVYFIPKLGDLIVFSGVNIMDKALTSHRSAAKDDAVFKIVGDSDGGHAVTVEQSVPAGGSTAAAPKGG